MKMIPIEEVKSEVKERGAASVFIELKDGVITVLHGTDKVRLAGWTANTGDWDRLWEVIRAMEAVK